MSVFHYQSLHKSPFYYSRHDGRELPNCDHYTDSLLRLPLYYDLSITDVNNVCTQIHKYLINSTAPIGTLL